MSFAWSTTGIDFWIVSIGRAELKETFEALGHGYDMMRKMSESGKISGVCHPRISVRFQIFWKCYFLGR
jgi:hypothetical protein